jgi:DNA repair protein RecO (recombination protein O)
MNKTYSTRAIVLNRRDLGESDRLFSLYTRDYGKIEAIATSARKATSKMAKFLEPLMEIELLLARGKNYDKIAEVRLIDSFTELKRDSRLWVLGCYSLEVVDKLTKVEVPQGEIFYLLKDILNLIKQGSGNLIQFYVLQLLSKLGYCPRLGSCVVCGKEFGVGDNIVLSLQRGGIACLGCLKFNRDDVKISYSVLNFLQKGLMKDLAVLQGVEINRYENKQVNQVISSFLNFHLDYRLNSVKFLV